MIKLVPYRDIFAEGQKTNTVVSSHSEVFAVVPKTHTAILTDYWLPGRGASLSSAQADDTANTGTLQWTSVTTDNYLPHSFGL